MEYLDSTISHIENWLKIQKINQNTIPIVKKILIILKWQKDVLGNIPDSIKSKIPSTFINEKYYKNEFQNINES